jgi:tRNA threonylcarbamoyladenosine biosynthesis protein TsaB
MDVLALDTTTREGSVALVRGDVIVDERPGDASRSHAERLPGELLDLAVVHGIAAHAIDLFAVASGPGSFTGLRIGIATIQGLALATGRRVVAVSALEAIAQRVSGELTPGAWIGTWMDARRQTVFTSLYRVGDAQQFSPERLVEVEGPTVDEAEATLARWRRLCGESAVVFAGDGAVLYSHVIESRAAFGSRLIQTPLLAGAIGRIASMRGARGETVDPAGIQPLYVRRPDAEVERERQRRAPLAR